MLLYLSAILLFLSYPFILIPMGCPGYISIGLIWSSLKLMERSPTNFDGLLIKAYMFWTPLFLECHVSTPCIQNDSSFSYAESSTCQSPKGSPNSLDIFPSIFVWECTVLMSSIQFRNNNHKNLLCNHLYCLLSFLILFTLIIMSVQK